MSGLTEIIESTLTNQRSPRKKKPKRYSDLVWNSQASVGDTVYMESYPDIKMTVSALPRVNHAAWTSGDEHFVSVQWFDIKRRMISMEVSASTLVRD